MMASGYCQGGGVGHIGYHPLGPYCFMAWEAPEPPEPDDDYDQEDE